MARNPTRKNPSRRSDATRAIKFVEELSWLLSTYSDLDFRALHNVRNYMAHASHPMSTYDLDRYVPDNPNVFFLVGTLPRLFIDEKLFVTNEDIAEFAEVALRVRIPRWQKKSKFELIGHIVCNTASLSDSEVTLVVQALQKIAKDDPHARKVVNERKQEGLSWSEVIQKLTSDN